MFDFFTWIADLFSDLSDKILGFLPLSPIVYVESIPEVQKYMGMLNWFMPIYSMISLTEAWLVAVLAYYVVQTILRWINVVE